MVLSGDQLRRFGDDGYLLLPGVVPETLLAAVDQEIDALTAADPPPVNTVARTSWFLPPGRLPAADAALRRSGALDIAGELVAPHTVDLALDHISCARVDRRARTRAARNDRVDVCRLAGVQRFRAGEGGARRDRVQGWRTGHGR